MSAGPHREPLQPTARGTAIGAVGIVAGGTGLLFHRADLFLIGLALILAVVGSHLALRFTAQRLTAHRTIRPDAVNAGEDAVIALVLRSADGRPVRLHRWQDMVPAGIEAGPGEEVRATPGEPGSVILRYPVHAARRGRYAIGPLRIRRVDPLGLATTEMTVGTPESLLVRPRVAELSGSTLDDSAVGGADLVVMRRTTPAVDEVSARDYQRGDPLRRVNWHASAKRGRLMVRLEEQRADPQSWLLLDTVGWRPDQPSEAFELAIELAASIGVHALERGFMIGIVETGLPQLEGEGAASGAEFVPPEGARLLVGQLAPIASAPASSDAIGVFAEALHRAGADTPAFAILAGGSPESWTDLAEVGRLAEPAIAFLLTPEAATAQVGLERFGWTCVVVEPGTGPAAAWGAATEALARRFGRTRA